MMESVAQAPPGSSCARAANDNADARWPIATFSVQELHELVRMNVLEPDPSSPVASLLCGNLPPGSDRPGVRATLAEKGLMRRAPHEPTSELGACLLLSLRVLARPRARMMLTRYSPEGEPSVLPLFLGSALAVPAFLDDAGLHVGMPMERAAVSESLEHQLAGEDSPPAEERFVLSPALLETVEGLWCGTGRAFDQPIPRNVALAVLAHLPDCGGEPEDQLAKLIGSPVACEDSTGIRFTSIARPWMERVLSGHSCELSFASLEEGAGSPLRPQRLLFLGPPGRRILCSGINGLDDLEAVLAQGQEQDVVPGPWTANRADTAEPALVLSALPHPVLRWYLRRLLH